MFTYTNNQIENWLNPFPYEAMRSDFRFVATNIAKVKTLNYDDCRKYKSTLNNLISQFENKWSKIFEQRSLIFADWRHEKRLLRYVRTLRDEYRTI
jgi:hypothetical protein